MLVLRTRFLAGRYHATGWDHHVNEGTIEWPPSPWRILRALVAASYRLPEKPSEEVLTRLLEPLAESLPSYHVPPYSEGHTRHYMPLDNKGLPGDKSALIFDAFVAPGSGPDEADGELHIVWPEISLADESRVLLAQLCEQLGYLGRAESWVEITPEHDSVPQTPNCLPAPAGEPEGRSLRLMAPTRRTEHIAWRDRYVASLPKRKRGSVPESLIDILRQDTGQLRSAGWSSTPGTRWVTYGFVRRSVPKRRSRIELSAPVAAVYQIAGAVLPPVTKTLQLGEQIHCTLLSKRLGGPLPAFAPGNVGAQDHAAICPFSLDGDGRLDRVLVFMASGFDEPATRRLQRIRRVWGVGTKPLTLTLLATLSEKDVPRTPGLPSPMRAARRWQSTTPFVLPRHPKVNRAGKPKLDNHGQWIDGPEAQLRLELSRRGFPDPVAVEPSDELSVGGRRLPWYRFQRKRFGGGGANGGTRGYGFSIAFAEPVRGPVLVGYGRFFGLGQFEPRPDRDNDVAAEP